MDGGTVFLMVHPQNLCGVGDGLLDEILKVPVDAACGIEELSRRGPLGGLSLNSAEDRFAGHLGEGIKGRGPAEAQFVGVWSMFLSLRKSVKSAVSIPNRLL